MIDSDLLQSNYLGRDGFRWWIGQVADPEISGWGEAKEVNAKQQVPEDADVDGEMYLRRCKVRILGYHTISDKDGYVLKESDLPWAHIMVPAGQGTGVHGVGEFHEYRGGESVIGFFLDGDEGQQPVIIGGFGNQPPNEKNKKEKQSEITDEKDCIVKPFQPKFKTQNKLKYLHLIKQQSSASSTGDTTNALTGKTTEADPEAQTDPTLRENVGSGSANSPGGHKAAGKLEREVTVTRETELEKYNLIGQVQVILEGLQKSLRSINEYKDLYLGNTIHTAKSLKIQIDGYAKKIAGLIRAFFERFKSMLFKQFEEALNAALAFIGETFKPIISIGVQRGIEAIICKIDLILAEFGIFNVVSNAINELISGRFIDSLLCAAEELITNILNEFLGPIFDAISGALDLFAGFLQGIDNIVSNALSLATEFLDRILDFFSCFDFETSGDASWSLSGPSKIQERDFINVLSGLDIDIKLPDSLLDIPASPLVCDAYNGYLFPPIVEISFGNGQASAVVSEGEIIGIYIDEPGIGYSPLVPPAISIIQPGVWGAGGGAKATAVIDANTGGISDIIVTNPGRNYVSIPQLAQTSISAPESLEDDDEIPRNKISNTENVIPFLDDLYIIDPGFGYTKDDTTILIDGQNIEDLGFDTSIEIGPEGSIVEININNTNNFPFTFSKRPEVEIVSDTGSSANIVPNINFLLIRDFTSNIEGLGVDSVDDELVNVTDVNGKEITVKSSEILQVVQCYN